MEMVKGGYTPDFVVKREYRQTRPREAPLRASNCPKFSPEALARCAHSPCRARTPFFFFFRKTKTEAAATLQKIGQSNPPLSGGWHVCLVLHDLSKFLQFYRFVQQIGSCTENFQGARMIPRGKEMKERVWGIDLNATDQLE